MNPYFGYQLYQSERSKSRAEVIASDQAVGSQSAGLVRASRRLASRLSGSGIAGRRQAAPQPSAQRTTGRPASAS